jgi:predicted KAP-like P-loop ATPase
LRSSARRIADALSDTVPALKGLLRLFPANTQKDDIESLKRALSRLPKRVVVLLDELDRMERAELLSLLKVVRGIASLPNVSFVCAAERKKLTETVCEDSDDDANLYFEKFFPSSVQIPKSDPQALQNAGIERLVSALRSRQWFKDEAEVTQYREDLDKIWPARVAYWIRNLRAIGLLANDVSVAAAPLRRQVDPVDLTLIEMLRRFKPKVYDIISRE